MIQKVKFKMSSVVSPKYIVIDEPHSVWSKVISIVHLAAELTKADLHARQFQRFLGPVWWIVEPSLMSLVFFFLTTRLNYSTGANHFMFIFIGLTVWRFFQRSVENSTFAYVGYGYVIRQINFPLIAVNVSMIFTELVFFLCGMLFIFVFGAAFGMLSFGWTYLFLPVLIGSLGLFTLGTVIFVSVAGVYIRDLPPPLTLFLSIVFFFSPGIYKPGELTGVLKLMATVNPFYYYFPAFRDILLQNQLPPMFPLFVWTLIAFGIVAISIWLYGQVRPHLLRIL
jgi:ABC-type polysaccharide/polyol phosphate export permease